jgi:mannosyl-oligosaccharide alpha-1,2-mannosidase
MDHLACFAGAMYAVAAQDGGRFDAEYMTLADEIGETCYKMYTNTRSGLSPEFVNFVAGSDLVTPSTAPYNIGRPEAVETWFYMWYFTRDPKWREMGWTVFEAFERYAATPSGWTALPNVNDVNRKRDDKMESFVLAETVKYFYLLFDPDYPIKLEEFVFNTEAHPLRPIDPM